MIKKRFSRQNKWTNEGCSLHWFVFDHLEFVTCHERDCGQISDKCLEWKIVLSYMSKEVLQSLPSEKLPFQVAKKSAKK
jgi:hypothetical protein